MILSSLKVETQGLAEATPAEVEGKNGLVQYMLHLEGAQFSLSLMPALA